MRLVVVLMSCELRTVSTLYAVRRSITRMSEELPRQWVVVRKDLAETWPRGSVVAQACHASVAALWSHRDDELTAQYLGALERMHKVVLEVKDGDELEQIAAKLVRPCRGRSPARRPPTVSRTISGLSSRRVSRPVSPRRPILRRMRRRLLRGSDSAPKLATTLMLLSFIEGGCCGRKGGEWG